MDKRTRYTLKVIKDAFLDQIEEKAYSNIRVTDICKEADISRSTFYQHFTKMDDLLNSVLDDALANIEGSFLNLKSKTQNEHDVEEVCRYPLCHFIRKNSKYQRLFLDTALSEHIIRKIAHTYKKEYIEALKRETSMSDEKIEAIFWFQIHGCFSVVTHNINLTDEEWEKMKCTLDSFLQRGIYGKLPTELP